MYKGPLHESVANTVTELWNDSCSLPEIQYAIESGGVGATTNPVIVTEVLGKELPTYRAAIDAIIAQNPTANEDILAWKIIEHMAVVGAKEFLPIFESSNGKCGRLSIQTDARYYRDAKYMAEQAVYFNTLAPNMQVKLPVTEAGVQAIEEATFHGVNVNATVCFTVAQSLAVAEAVERGLKRRKDAGLPTQDMRPVCTIMVGRTDDWLKVVAAKEKKAITPGVLDWAGVAVFKHAYAIYQQRGYQTRLLSAACRSHLHWSEFIGGDVVLTLPHAYQVQFNNSAVSPEARIDKPVDGAILAELKTMPEFLLAYEGDALTPAQFLPYGATARTLRAFLQGYGNLLAILRDVMIPNPDA